MKKSISLLLLLIPIVAFLLFQVWVYPWEKVLLTFLVLFMIYRFNKTGEVRTKTNSKFFFGILSSVLIILTLLQVLKPKFEDRKLEERYFSFKTWSLYYAIEYDDWSDQFYYIKQYKPFAKDTMIVNEKIESDSKSNSIHERLNVQ